MALVTNEMIYELAVAVDTQVSRMDARLVSIDGHLDAMEALVRDMRQKADGTSGNIANIYQTLGRLDARVSRIEKRLDIIEEPAE
jgi:predicted  nucleic acid-binding Zn-ribbon protein